MPQLRLLASSLLVSALVIPAAAQAPSHSQPRPSAATLPLAAVVTTPLPTFDFNAPTADPSRAALKLTKPGDLKLNINKNAIAIDDLHLIKPAQPLAELHSPCATLRVYGFTPKDLKSPHPRPSTETDCTAIASAHLKPIDAPATAARTPSPTTQTTVTPK